MRRDLSRMLAELNEVADEAEADFTAPELEDLVLKATLSAVLLQDTGTTVASFVANLVQGADGNLPEKFAAACRSRLGLESFDPLFRLAELINELSIPVFPAKLSAVKSARLILGSSPCIFIADDLLFDQLYLCAFELGALLANKGWARRRPYLRATSRLDSDFRSLRGIDLFARDFAFELLLPASGVGVSLKKLRQLLNIKNKAVGDIELICLARIFGVSFEVAALRCQKLGLLPPGGAASMARFIRENFQSAEARAQSLNLPDHPKITFPLIPDLLQNSLTQAVGDGALSAEEASLALSVPAGELLRLIDVNVH